MKSNQIQKRDIFQLFASGKTPRQVAGMLDGSGGRNGSSGADLQKKADKLYEEYLWLPMIEKLRITLMAESVSNRQHRLIDDIFDLKRIDALLDSIDDKTEEKRLTSLLDIKRKIKERMAKDQAADVNDQPEQEDEASDDEIEEIYREIFGSSAS